MTAVRTGLDLAPFLRPRSIALIGASTDESSISARPARYLRRLGYAGAVNVVHPRERVVGGYPAVPSLSDLPEPPDVAMVVVSAPRVVDALQQCADVGTRAAVIIASGFEGPAGEALRRQLEDFLAGHPGLRVVGPNCNGVLAVDSGAALCFSSVLLDEDPLPGCVSLVTQSGAIGNGLLLALQRRGVGVRNWFSTGDELSIGSIELATALLHEDVRGVGLFLEGLTDAWALPALADAIESTGKPVLALRAPQSESSRAAAFAHTGRVIGDDFIGREALNQCGVTLVDSIADLTDGLTVLSALPPARHPAGPVRTAVLSVSGGVGVFAAEAISRDPSLQLSSFDDALLADLAAVLPPGLPIANPLDVPLLGRTDVFAECLRVLAASPCCDAVLVVASTLAHDYEALSRAAVDPGARVVITHLSPEERFTPSQARALATRGVATVPSVDSAARWLAATSRRAGATPGQPDDVSTHLDPQGRGGPGQRGVVASAVLLPEPVTGMLAPARVVATIDEARACADEWGRIALKAEGSILAHRTEAGAVRTGLDLAHPAELASAFADVSDVCTRLGERVVAQQMAEPGLEVMVSVLRDRELGPVVVVRPGGVLVELVAETVVLAGSASRWAAALRGSAVLGRLLQGFRGEPARDVGALVRLAVGLHDAMRHDAAIDLVECNPVIVQQEGRGVSIVDIMTVVRT